MKSFWKKIKKPIIVLAPMSGISDEPFRQMLLFLGRPDVFWTEFVSVDGLFSKGSKKFLEELKFIKFEHPIVAQVFGTKPELFEKATKLIGELGFDGIDINMGCPNREIEKYGAGAALIKNFQLAREIIRATKKGAGAMPVSVKTRIGYSKDEINVWIKGLLKENLSALIVHLRARNEAFRPPAHWELAEKIVKLRDKVAPETLILGNGDVKSFKEAKKIAKKTGVDGVMIGRGAAQNPWIFSGKTPAPSQRLAAVIRHAKLFEKLNQRKIGKKGRIKNFASVKKFFKGYVSGLEGAKDLRQLLMEAESAGDIEKIIKNYLKK